jgi:hypothetical protein
MRMRPFLASLRSFIPEHGNVFEAGVAFQIGDAKGVGFEHALDFLVGELRERARMAGSFNDDFVRANGVHAIENAVGVAVGIALDVIERAGVRVRADLRVALRRERQQKIGLRGIFRAKRARPGPFLAALAVADDHPTASDGILAKFHLVSVHFIPKIAAHKGV